MSLATIRSRALAGMNASKVFVEVHLANGLPAFTIVGLPETEVKESKDRVRAAIQNSQFEFPANRRITVNLAPADLPKDSGRFDLPIALGILAASGQLPPAELDKYEFAGELSLSGELRAIRGALAMALALLRSDDIPARAIMLPPDSAREAALATGIEVYGARSLLEACAHLRSTNRDDRLPLEETTAPSPNVGYPDMADVRGQVHARRALEICAAGQHSLLMVGPPGSGKSMLAARLPGILPPMTQTEALSAAAVQSLSGSGFALNTWQRRPFRTPHHSASTVALVGGGNPPRPGEISLAHEGILFLDELPEFDRRVLEALREPLESGHITISRAARQSDFAAAFQLVAAMNPCPCGDLGHPSRICRCSPDQVARYQSRISGPLLDRIDLQIAVPALPHDELIRARPGETSSAVRDRVCAARERQMARQGKTNQALTVPDIDTVASLPASAEILLRNAMDRLGWSARSYHRVLRVARTIADLSGSDELTSAHVAEAIQYRRGLAMH